MSIELDIVNHMLRTVGESTTPTLETQHPSVMQAKSALETYNRTFQSKGWWFNREFGIKLTPDVGNKISVPTEWLAFYPAMPDAAYVSSENKVRYQKRNGKVFDVYNNTSKITHPLYVDALVFISIEDMPGIAQEYLKHWCAEEYYLDDDGDIAKKDRLQERTEKAWAFLHAEELRSTRPNAMQTPFSQKLKYRIGQMGSPTNPRFPGGRR